MDENLQQVYSGLAARCNKMNATSLPSRRL